eukprot:6145705-Alexandrium_andersonii.AAC.1
MAFLEMSILASISEKRASAFSSWRRTILVVASMNLTDMSVSERSTWATISARKASRMSLSGSADGEGVDESP